MSGPIVVSFGEALTDLVTRGGDDFRALPGGAGWNVARAVAALGIPCAWAGCLSLDRFGDQLWAASLAAGLDVRFIQRREAPPLLAVVDRLDPPHYFFLGEGAADLGFQADRLPEGWRASLRWAHFGGISLVREPLGSRLEALADELVAEGVNVSFDPNHRVSMGEADRPRLLRFLRRAALVKVSDEDLRGYFPGEDPEETLASLRALNPDATWLYTRGAAGATLLAPGVCLRAPARRVAVVDTVGAGDASVAALLFARLRGEPPERQLHLALTNAALACEGAGAVAPTRARLEAAAAEWSSSAVADPPAEPGGRRRLGRYELVRKVGSGGQGQVHEAIWHGPGGFRRRVAIKLVEDGTGLAREARMGGLLRHPHLVDVYEIGEHEGSWFLAMEYCPDGTLADHLGLSPRAAVEVALQVCDALGYAHDELGLVHLDLKPANLLLQGTSVKVADLGIARLRGDAGRRVEGTRGYMSPERLRGAEPDARADVYALGVVIHELITGHLPRDSETVLPRSGSWFDASTASRALLDKEELGRADPRPPLAVPGLDVVVARCLAPDPADRYASMGELAAALAALQVEGDPLAARLAERPGAAEGALDDGGPRALEIAEELVGRDEELTWLEARLTSPGLVTLKGPAGVGKSALARAAADRYRRGGGGPAWTCDLGEARSAGDLVATLARALGVPLGQGGLEPAAQVGHALAARGDALVVLDTFEHLVSCAPQLGSIRAQAPRARFLVTSRSRLRLDDEEVVEVGVLPLEASTALLRARALRRGVELDDGPVVAELARRLDGLPLAIELAAGRLGVLTAADVLARLSPALLRSGSLDQGGREATLRGALRSGWDLLDEAARSTLTQLSVFAGGFTPVAVAEVVELPPGARHEDVLQGLLDGSWLTARDGRLTLLEPVREFAAELLDDPLPVELRHADHYGHWAAPERLAGLERRGGERVRAELRRDLPNVDLAGRRAVARGDGARAAACVEAAWGERELTGPFGAMIDLAVEVAALPGLSARARGEVFRIAGHAAVHAGRLDEAGAHLGEALAAAVAIGDRALRAGVHEALGQRARTLGFGAEEGEHHEAALRLRQEIGDRRGVGVALGRLGNVSRDRSRLEEARQRYEQALAIHREVGDRRSEATTLGSLGSLDAAVGEVTRGRARLEESLAAHQELGNRRIAVSVLANLGNLERVEGRSEESMARYEAALVIARELGMREHEAAIAGNLAGALAELGRAEEAWGHLQRALAIQRETGARRSEAMILLNLALLEFQWGRIDEALARGEQALRIYREIDDLRGQMLALEHCAEFRLERGELDLAWTWFDEALRVCRAVGLRSHEGMLLNHLAMVAEARGRGSEARGLAEAAVHIHREVGEPKREAAARSTLARLDLAEGNVASALARLEDAIALVGPTGDPMRSANLHSSYARALASVGRRAEAEAKLDEAERAIAGKGGPASRAAFASVRVHLALAARRLDEARAALERAEGLGEGLPPLSAAGRLLGEARAALAAAAPARSEP